MLDGGEVRGMASARVCSGRRSPRISGTMLGLRFSAAAMQLDPILLASSAAMDLDIFFCLCPTRTQALVPLIPPPQVERIFRQSAEFCSEHETWKLNVAHTYFMQVRLIWNRASSSRLRSVTASQYKASSQRAS